MDENLPPVDHAAAQGGVTLRHLVLALLWALGLMQAGLWAFLGLPLWWFVAGGALLAWAIIGAGRGGGWDRVRVPWRDLAVCGVVATVLLALGGEGRLTYANTDWQVRLAVLRDLAGHPWPFAYDVPGGPTLLRAPLGMYLGPAMVGKASGHIYGAELAMWAQNSLLLTLVLGAGSALFADGRAKLTGLAVFLGFSGMDIVGQALAGQPLMLHLEQWAVFQYSAHVTQLFWVPQHCLAGWIFALAYLAWRRAMVPRAVLGLLMPLLPLLSPLAAMGCVPFVLHAYAPLARQAFGRQAFWRRACWGDLGWPLPGAAAALPGLTYLLVACDQVGAGNQVGNQATPLPLATYPLFILLEIGAYLLALRLRPHAGAYGATTAWMVVLSLLVIPFGRVGGGMDFVMRASIPALAILAVLAAEVCVEARAHSGWRQAALVAQSALLIGLATPLGEIARAIVWPRAPAVTCGYYGVVPLGYATYIAPLARFPALIRPHAAAMVTPERSAICWQGRWPDAVDGANVAVHPGRS